MRIGIDLGGTKIEAVALGVDGRILTRQRVPAPQGDYRATIESLANLVERCEAAAGTTGTVGVGIPGTISPASGLVKNANSTWLIGHPLAEDLSRRLGRPVRLANDANCFALSEATDGAGAGARVVFGVILGTGVGGGIVIDGRLIVGANAVTGEWGHNALPGGGPGTATGSEMPGPPCYCGRNGCIETYLSGPGLARDFHLHTGQHWSPEDIVEVAGRGETDAESCLSRYEDRMARGLASVINLLDPDVIVLGGGVSNVARLYVNVPRLWGRYVFSDVVVTRLVAPVHGDASGVRGAAWLWPAELRVE